MRRPFIAGNWKLNKSIDAASALAQKIVEGVTPDMEVDVTIAPPFTALAAVREVIESSPIALAAQNCYPEARGAFTGEVSPLLLRDAGCQYVIVGHSERRHLLNESNDFINRKVRAVIGSDLHVILCVGETLEERENGKTFNVLSKQLKECFLGVPASVSQQITVAYEPVWAIGTGKTATPDQAQEVHCFLRDMLDRNFGGEASKIIPILYGGSVKPDNIAALLAEPDIDGALVGGASLKAEDFLALIRNALGM